MFSRLAHFGKRKYEEQFDMSSEEFYRRFRAGELGDGMDFVEWSAFYEMYQAVRQGLVAPVEARTSIATPWHSQRLWHSYPCARMDYLPLALRLPQRSRVSHRRSRK